MRRGLKPAMIVQLYAALKRRSSTVLRALVSFSGPSQAGFCGMVDLMAPGRF